MPSVDQVAALASLLGRCLSGDRPRAVAYFPQPIAVSCEKAPSPGAMCVVKKAGGPRAARLET
jgi:hypothetical protein